MLAPPLVGGHDEEDVDEEDVGVDDAELEGYNRHRAPSPAFPIAFPRRKPSPGDAGVRSPIAGRMRSKSGKEEEGEKKVRDWIQGMVLDSAHQGEE